MDKILKLKEWLGNPNNYDAVFITRKNSLPEVFVSRDSIMVFLDEN